MPGTVAVLSDQFGDNDLSSNQAPCSPAQCSAEEPLSHDMCAMLQLLQQDPHHQLPLQS